MEFWAQSVYLTRLRDRSGGGRGFARALDAVCERCGAVYLADPPDDPATGGRGQRAATRRLMAECPDHPFLLVVE